ncbi:MAG: hypothetical protein I8H87_12220 [Comamonadaceae bacterium]|jgi:hypothetical protein|nr:hypothetical protein [Comamonadaceae bacterium]
MNKLLIALSLALPLGAWATPPAAGQAMPPVAVKDQHERDWRIAPDTQLVLFAAGRTASNLAMAVLGAQSKGFLATRHAVYLADMSKMPGFVTRTFALPSLREQPFAVGVVLDDKLLADWPRQDDAVTLIRLKDGQVAGVDYAKTEAQLRGALGIAP